jgi:hypothetical protein
MFVKQLNLTNYVRSPADAFVFFCRKINCEIAKMENMEVFQREHVKATADREFSISDYKPAPVMVQICSFEPQNGKTVVTILSISGNFLLGLEEYNAEHVVDHEYFIFHHLRRIYDFLKQTNYAVNVSVRIEYTTETFYKLIRDIVAKLSLPLAIESIEGVTWRRVAKLQQLLPTLKCYRKNIQSEAMLSLVSQLILYRMYTIPDEDNHNLHHLRFVCGDLAYEVAGRDKLVKALIMAMD